jgi:hypothetical protein
MTNSPSLSATRLRLEIAARNRLYAVGRPHVESYGDPPVIVYAPDEAGHGNFFNPAYRAIAVRPEWFRRFGKVHAQGRSLPKAERKWRELDSSMSSDALLMNIFCTPGVAQSQAVQSMLGVEGDEEPIFGWKAQVPLANGRADRTEVDMCWNNLLVEAKLTETDFQCCLPALIHTYRDFTSVFDTELLPRIPIATGRRKPSAEFPEDYTQEEVRVAAEEWQPHVWEVPAESVNGFASYQLVRNVLAARATNKDFCVLLDERRPDLREAWFRVMSAVKDSTLRVRLKVLTWQELAAVLPKDLREFLCQKYGIVPPGEAPWPMEHLAIGGSI